MKTGLNILGQVRAWAQSHPQRIAHRCGAESLSYRQLETGSDVFAAELAETLPDDHSPVAVIGHKEPELLCAFLGAVKSGHPYIPIDSSLPSARISAILDLANPPLIWTADAIRALLRRPSVGNPVPPPREIHPEDPWYIIFTSGSTGEPKGVVITAGCLDSFVIWMLSEQNFKPAEVFLNQAPFSFDLSVMDLYLSLVTGSTLFSVTADQVSDPPVLFAALRGSQVTVWVSTPSFAKFCLAEPSFDQESLPFVRKFLFCGEVLPVELVRELMERFPSAEVWNTYGPTETTCATTSLRVSADCLERFPQLPVGRPKAGSRILVLKEGGEAAGENEPGEIVIAGPNVSPGYLYRPELTARAFYRLEGYPAYRTGDRGHFAEGLLFFDGRIDNQVKLHGYRIELEDVEANLRKLPEVADAVVLPAFKNGLADHLEAFVLTRDVAETSPFELTRLLKRKLGLLLPAYMLPRKFYRLVQFPLTPNGKTDRRKLAKSMQ